MEIKGSLEEKIKSGNVVLFLGAGVGQAIGLLGTKDISNLLFDKAKQPNEYTAYKDNFEQLVARLDKNSNYSRQWTNQKICEYFIDSRNYKNIKLAERLLMHSWQSVFTTNYDLTLEYAFEKIRTSAPQRLIPVTDPYELKVIQDRDFNKLKYFKLHGCVREMDANPSRAQKFVITTKDFSESSSRNKFILQEFVSLSYNVPIIFIGFNVQKNSMLLDSIYEVHKYLRESTQQQFSNFYVLLHKIDPDVQFELEELDINVLVGDFENFIGEVERISKSDETEIHHIKDEVISISYNVGNRQLLKIPLSEYNKNCEQFVAYHDNYFKEKKSIFDRLNRGEVLDAWKSQPTDMFIFSDKCIRRTQQTSMFNIIKRQIDDIRLFKPIDISEKHIAKDKLVIWGERGAGKTVLVKQVCKQIYEELGNPIIFLREDSIYIENSDGAERIISGWNGKTLDKFISYFSKSEDGQKTIPIIVADNLPHMMYAVKNIYKHLLNHGKDFLLILILNESDYLIEKSIGNVNTHADKEYDNYTAIAVNYKLDDSEILKLFENVKKDNVIINEFKPQLIEKAKDDVFGKRDLLFILFMWFDEKFRRLEDIILEEAKKINGEENFKNLYLSIAVFQQYNLEPRIDLCAISLGITERDFSILKDRPLFKSLIKLRKHDLHLESYAFTRHARFTYKLLNELLLGTIQEKVEIELTIIENVLKAIRPIDIDFVVLLFNSLYVAKKFTPRNLIRLKEASEERNFFKNDFVLNHQFAAYLIRENAQEHFDKVEYYLDLALESAPEINKSSIIHSKGYLEVKKYLNTGDLAHYDNAKHFFERVRATSNIPEEPDYVSEVDLITERILREKNSIEKTMLKAERTALITEAMSVVSPERQNYILNRQEFVNKYSDLPKEERKNILEYIRSGKASHTIIKYYLDSKINVKNTDSWFKIKEIIDQYYNDRSTLATIVILSTYTKICFILPADIRFDFMRKYFDEIVKNRENNLSFTLVAEYQRTLLMDAFVLGKFDFVKNAMDDYRSSYRNSFPSFQKDEYIMPDYYYIFPVSEETEKKQINLFLNLSEDFYLQKIAIRYDKQSYIDYNRSDIFFNIVIDTYTQFYIRCLKRELGGDTQSRVFLDFCIRFGKDGFRAADVRIV